MKKFLLSVIVLMITGTTSAFSQVKIYNDQRDELSGIVWRLAGAEEFNQKLYASYQKDIETYFAKFTKHPLMDFIRSMREDPFLVAYNAVSGATDVFKIENGIVQIGSAEVVSQYTSIDKRWTVDNMNRYVSLLNDFYRKSKFERFYETHQPLYQRYVDSLKVVIDGIDTKWFETFYGIPLKDFDVVSCLSYGGGNYGGEYNLAGVQYRKITIGGGYDIDIAGVSGAYKGIIMHELNHMFSTKIIQPYKDQLMPSAQKIFPYVEQQVTKLGHGEAFTVVLESLNELFALMHSKDVRGVILRHEIMAAYRQGFPWIERAIRYMDNFYANRDIYSSIADFMPQLVGFINLTADNMDAIMEDSKRTPRVVATFPAYGSVVDTTLKEVRIQFSHPMSAGISHDGVLEREDVLSFRKPFDENDDGIDFYWADDYTIVYPVTTVLEKGKQYGIQIHQGVLCRKNTGVAVDQPYTLIFQVE